MRWDSDLPDELKPVVRQFGSHTRLLAGPGTGKTLTLQRHIAYMIQEKSVDPDRILALTFTRAAAFELRKRISDILEDEHVHPKVSTLHSFALTQLLHNSDRIDSIPTPLRIADDWEEREIIFEDLKEILRYKIKDVKEKFSLLSADWQTLDADEADWERKFVDPAFLGAWQKHRQIYGYTLRSELVYQLKRALERIGSFQFDSEYRFLLVDEYQDLNRCDLAIVTKFKDRGILVYCAGDDDQSIYGFRFAHPEGIRRFDRDFIPCKPLSLEICLRCDKEIINLAIFIARLDPSRIDKPLRPRPDAGNGEVKILRFDNQDHEANGVSLICQYLIEKKDYRPNDIMILMRGDRHGLFSKSIRDKLLSKDIPVKIQENETPLDNNEGRMLLAILRLLANPSDNLSFRTLYMLKKGIGEQSIFSIYNLAKEKGINFIAAAQYICEKPEIIPKNGHKICDAIKEIIGLYSKFVDKADAVKDNPDQGKLIEFLNSLAEETIPISEKKGEIVNFLINLIIETEASNLKELFIELSSLNQDIEQELAEDEINIMTMHKAKGLSSKAVIIVACEDEYLPGRQEGNAEEDERRLLYVSLSRAKHFLAITYCENRIGPQAHSGRTAGDSARNLTRFLRDAPVSPMDGNRYIASLRQ